ncbi:MAG: hypothetical protein EXS47_02570 [Candidatus Zambryskibacteria bacterium]|nr:hypothetical protein [Candidatus Zambryskibacteria bacterium]
MPNFEQPQSPTPEREPKIFFCQDCKNEIKKAGGFFSIQVIGTCEKCGGMTSTKSLKICRKCAKEMHICQNCVKPLEQSEEYGH